MSEPEPVGGLRDDHVVTTEAHFDDGAVERLREDTHALEAAAVRLRDSIQGSWDHPNGGVYITHIATAAQAIIAATGRLGNALDKAADSIGSRAATGYLDYQGEQTDATDAIQSLASRVRAAAGDLRRVHGANLDLLSALGSIGQR